MHMTLRFHNFKQVTPMKYVYEMVLVSRTACFYCEILLLFSHFTAQPFLIRATFFFETYSVREIIHNFQSVIRQCLTVIEFWYGAIIHHLRLFALIWNINGFFWMREEMSIWSQRSSTTPGVYPSILCTGQRKESADLLLLLSFFLKDKKMDSLNMQRRA